MKIIIVVPAYNEEIRIKEFLTELVKVKYPVIAVDDGSSDATYEILTGFEKKYPNITILRHKVNLGKGAAMKTGADAAFKLGANAVVFMDSDGQHTTKDLPQFIEALNSGYEVVFGSRNLSHGVPLVRYLGNKFASILISLLFGIYISDILSGYRAMTGKGYEKIKWESRGYAVETEMVIRSAKANIKSCEVPVTTLYYDEFKGVSLMDSFHIFFDVIRWRLRK